MSRVALREPRPEQSTRPAAPTLATPRRTEVAARALEHEAARVAETVGSDPAPLSAASTHGGSLPPPMRAFMEDRLGHDFSRVRVHADPAAADRARALGARAFTRGDDVFFGHGEYAPATARGRQLLAHELTHVVQQADGVTPGIQCAPKDCDPTKRADVEAEVRARVEAAAKDAAALPELYLALKRARACFADFDEAAFLALVPASPSIYPSALRKEISKGHGKEVAKDDRKLAWAESRRPFAGYRVSGFDTARRFTSGENARLLGATPAPSHEGFREFSADPAKAQPAFEEASVLVFSGHQYAQYKLPGVWTDGGDNVLDVRGIKGPLTNVKLLISTSCATLCKEAFEVWKGIFPNAVFLGAARSTPLKGSVLANAFVKSLPADLLFDPGAPGLSSAISAWKSAVEKTQTGNVRGGVLDIAAATVEVWDGKKWLSLGATDEDNVCKVKGDYSASRPDPRGGP